MVGRNVGHEIVRHVGVYQREKVMVGREVSHEIVRHVRVYQWEK